MSTKPVLRYTFLAHLPDSAPPRRVSGGAGSQSTRSQRAANAGLPGGGQSTRPRMAAKKGYRAAAKARDPGERPKQDCRATGGASDRETRHGGGREPGQQALPATESRNQPLRTSRARIPDPAAGPGCRHCRHPDTGSAIFANSPHRLPAPGNRPHGTDEDRAEGIQG